MILQKSSTEQSGFTIWIDLVKGLSKGSLMAASYIVSFLYALFLFINVFETTNGKAYIIPACVVGIVLALLYHRSQPKIDLSGWSWFYGVVFFLNIIMGAGAFLYAVNLISSLSSHGMVTVFTPTLELTLSMAILYKIIASLIVIFLFPFTLFIFIIPVLWIVNFSIERIQNRTDEWRTALTKKMSGPILVVVAGLVFIVMQYMEEIVTSLEKNLPLLIGSIPIYWLYFFIVSPIRRSIRPPAPATGTSIT